MNENQHWQSFVVRHDFVYQQNEITLDGLSNNRAVSQRLKMTHQV